MIERALWVRGRVIPFDIDVINDYLKDAYELPQWGLDVFSWELHGNNWNYDKIVVDICIGVEVYEIR